MKTVATALAASALLFSSFAFADEETFNATDANGDGVLSVEEIQAAFPTTSEETFGEIDANGDGTVDLEEFDDALDSGALVKA